MKGRKPHGNRGEGAFQTGQWKAKEVSGVSFKNLRAHLHGGTFPPEYEQVNTDPTLKQHLPWSTAVIYSHGHWEPLLDINMEINWKCEINQQSEDPNTPLIWNKHSLSWSFFLEDYSFRRNNLKTAEKLELVQTHIDKYRVHQKILHANYGGEKSQGTTQIGHSLTHLWKLSTGWPNSHLSPRPLYTFPKQKRNTMSCSPLDPDSLHTSLSLI